MTEDEVDKLKKEIKLLKEKYKKKCERIKKLNEKLKYISRSDKERSAWTHSSWLQDRILSDLTKHLDFSVFDVEYEYDDKNYFNAKLSTYGVRWIKEALCLNLAKEHDLIIYPNEIVIITLKKLW